MNPGKDPTTGRFTRGNRFGRGAPRPGATHRLRAMLYRSVTAADMEAMVRALVDKAIGGDIKAMTLLFAYVMGKPIQSVEATVQTMDPQEARRRLVEVFGLDAGATEHGER